MFTPIDLMLRRIEQSKSESDTAFFFQLMYAGELVLKLSVSGFLASIEDGRDRHQYRIAHGLVRADGIGEWSRALDDMLTGPASQGMHVSLKEDRRIFTERVGAGSWQYETVAALQRAFNQFRKSPVEMPAKLALRNWFSGFVELRNKTRGHGAPTATQCANACVDLEASIKNLCKNNPLFGRQWAYLHRNMSGRYRVISAGTSSDGFEFLKTKQSETLSRPFRDGLYIYLGEPKSVDLIKTDSELTDFYLPNGAFGQAKYELHSLLSDNRAEGDSAAYLKPATDLPPSETDAKGELVIRNNVWANIPEKPSDYVPRPALEKTIFDLLMNDRHPIVTLVGRGGIGKTSTALHVLEQISYTNRFDAIIWFSARDIDLMNAGPKTVKPQVLTEQEISLEFSRLLDNGVSVATGAKAIDKMAENLRESTLGGPILFVFDNFETVRSPVDLFNWLDTNIRLQNKVLITSRFRDFKADFPVAVEGMEEQEADKLINLTSSRLGIAGLITSKFRSQLHQDSDGHPYIIKIILGEVADKGMTGRPEMIVARKEDILEALFERTYSSIAPLARHVFLTLCGWRSLVPALAVEAVALRHNAGDPGGAIDELERMSLIQRIATEEGAEFLEVPLAAALFGQKKLAVSPSKTLIENDVRLLQDLGPTNAGSAKEGVGPRIFSLFKKAAARIVDDASKLSETRPLLELIAAKYPPAWVMLADLHMEVGAVDRNARVGDYLRRFLEASDSGQHSKDVWLRLAAHYRETGELGAAVSAYVSAFELTNTPISDISNVANWINNQNKEISDMDPMDKSSMLGKLAAVMERRIRECSSTDLSRLAWLHLHMNNQDRALELAEMGNAMVGGNIHCQRLIDRIRQ